MRNEKKRVVHVTFDMRIGGAEQVIFNLATKTDPSRYDVSILCLDHPIGPFGIKIQERGYQITSFNRRPGFDSFLISQIYHYINRHNIDVLHCHQYTPYVYGLLGATFTKCKVIFTEHGRFYPDQLRFKRILVNPIFVFFTDYLTAISYATRKALVRYENFPNDRIRVVYNGIDESKFVNSVDKALIRHSLGIPESAQVIGTVARLDAIKNHNMMLRALKTVLQNYPDSFLLIVGDGPEREKLESVASELEVSSKVRFTGFREDPHLSYKIMDIFLLTSFSEGTAMTLLEAMASGLPCIVTDVGGNPEIVIKGETGLVIPSNDEKALAEKICTLLSNTKLKKEMGKAGRRRFEENFTVAKMVKAYEALYDGLV